MWALGDKVASTIVAQTVQIPTLPWSGSGKCLHAALHTLPMPVSLLPASPSLPKQAPGMGVPCLAGYRLAVDIWDPTAAEWLLVWVKGFWGQGAWTPGKWHVSPWDPQLPWAYPAGSPRGGPATPVVTVSLGVLTGLVAQWSEEDQKGQQMISIPLETYAQGCVKDVEEGLEVKLSPRAATCPLCTTISLWILQKCEGTLTAACPSVWVQLRMTRLGSRAL